MMKPVRFDVEAEEEFTAAAGWYEQERPGLGGDFVVSINETVLEVRERPESFPLAPAVPKSLGVRRAIVKRFPYAVVFLELPEEIRVLAVAHGARKPGYWRDRTPR